jgi:hypothetical protein
VSIVPRATGFVSILAFGLCGSGTAYAELVADPASVLRARFAALSSQIEHSPFPQHLYVESFEGPGDSRGDVYSVVDYPIITVNAAFKNASDWCAVLILHLNVKYCHPLVRDGRTVLSVAIGRKHDQPLDSAFRVEFVDRITALRPDYLDVELKAPSGPLGTGNYRIGLEAVGLDKDRTFIHLRYSYEYEFAARFAMQTYLATAGSSKVGFTVTGDPRAKNPEFIGGVRGAIERNTMRYYLAIDAYLGTLNVPPAARFERSIERWFDSTERYRPQLHEVDRDAYLEMKRSEYRRQQTFREGRR